GNLPWDKIRIREPISGIAGTNHRYSNIALVPRPLAFHLAQDVEIQSLETVEQLQHQAKTNCHFGGCETDDHQEHDLAVGITPTRAGRNEGQCDGVEHDLERHQHEDDV